MFPRSYERPAQSFQANLPLIVAAACAVLAMACSRAYPVTLPDPTIREAEPNGSAWTANGIGPIRPGDYFPIRGHVTDYGPDLFDGFAFVSDVPVEVEFILHADRPAADLDVCIYDPFLGEFVACFETPWNPEVGSVFVFEPGVEFHLVVSSFRGSTGYDLEVIGHALESAPEAAGARVAPKASHVPSRRESFWRAYAPPDRPVAQAQDQEREPVVRGYFASIDAVTGAVEQRRYLRIGDEVRILR